MQDYFHDASVPRPGIHGKATNPGASNKNLAAAYLAVGYLAVRHVQTESSAVWPGSLGARVHTFRQTTAPWLVSTNMGTSGL
jgi:hypothetical protein